MNSLRALMLLLVVTMAPLAGNAVASTDGQRAVGGVFVIHFHLNVASTLPAGSTITCKARIAPDAPTLAEAGRRSAVTPVETATGVALITGSAAECAVEIPFSWTVNDAQSGVTLSYQVEAISVSGPFPLVVRSSAQEGIGLDYPPQGANGGIRFNVTF